MRPAIFNVGGGAGRWKSSENGGGRGEGTLGFHFFRVLLCWRGFGLLLYGAQQNFLLSSLPSNLSSRFFLPLSLFSLKRHNSASIISPAAAAALQCFSLFVFLSVFRLLWQRHAEPPSLYAALFLFITTQEEDNLSESIWWGWDVEAKDKEETLASIKFRLGDSLILIYNKQYLYHRP